MLTVHQHDLSPPVNWTTLFHEFASRELLRESCNWGTAHVDLPQTRLSGREAALIHAHAQLFVTEFIHLIGRFHSWSHQPIHLEGRRYGAHWVVVRHWNDWSGQSLLACHYQTYQPTCHHHHLGHRSFAAARQGAASIRVHDARFSLVPDLRYSKCATQLSCF